MIKHIKYTSLLLLICITNPNFAMHTNKQVEAKRNKESQRVYSKDDTSFYAIRFVLLRSYLQPLHGRGMSIMPWHIGSKLLNSSFDHCENMPLLQYKAQSEVDGMLPSQQKPYQKHSFTLLRIQADKDYYKHYTIEEACKSTGATDEQYAPLNKKLHDQLEQSIRQAEWERRYRDAWVD
jgi:hypothetical protein